MRGSCGTPDDWDSRFISWVGLHGFHSWTSTRIAINIWLRFLAIVGFFFFHPSHFRRTTSSQDLSIRSLYGCLFGFMIQFPNYLTLDRAKPVGGMCQQLRWYIHTNLCNDFAHTHISFTSTRLHSCFFVFILLAYSFFFIHLNIHHHTSCVFIFYHLFIDSDFTLLTFHLCLFILFSHTATFIDQDTNLTYFVGIVAHYCLELTKSVVTVTS